LTTTRGIELRGDALERQRDDPSARRALVPQQPAASAGCGRGEPWAPCAQRRTDNRRIGGDHVERIGVEHERHRACDRLRRRDPGRRLRAETGPQTSASGVAFISSDARRSMSSGCPNRSTGADRR
jgi:hypothetical protein